MGVATKRTRLAALFALMLVVLIGCSDPESILAPPDADVTGIQTVLVYPFTNESPNRALADTVTANFMERLGAVGWYDVLSPERTNEFIEERRIDRRDMDYGSTEWHDAARDITLAVDGDGFVLGVVTDYKEHIELEEAYVNPTSDDIQWLADQRTTVTVTVRSKLVNAHTGATVYEQTATGQGRITEARQLNWVIPESPPDTVIPAPHRRDLDPALDRAIEDALDQLTRDILPRSVETREENDDGQ